MRLRRVRRTDDKTLTVVFDSDFRKGFLKVRPQIFQSRTVDENLLMITLSFELSNVGFHILPLLSPLQVEDTGTALIALGCGLAFLGLSSCPIKRKNSHPENLTSLLKGPFKVGLRSNSACATRSPNAASIASSV